jgi:extradiol dioxygenase family protein
MYEKLVAYEQEHGDCNVKRTGDNKKLGTWVGEQRRSFKKQVKGYQEGKSSDRYIALTEIGFVFDLLDQEWSKMYDQLVTYKQEYGDCNVKRTGDNKKLGTWVAKQRRSFKKQVKGYQAGKSSDRYIELNKIGFVFDRDDQAWSTMYEKLVTYEQEYGDCNVSRRTGDNKKLGAWGVMQRHYFKKQIKGYKAGKNSDRYIALTEIGFVWNT